MTSHLSPAELTDALDDRLAADRAAHLDECAQCGESLAALASTADDARDADGIPEPSPFFWEQLSNRIRLATANVPMTPAPWWRVQWRPALALGVPFVIIVVFAARFASFERPAATERAVSGVAASATTDTDESWQSVELIAAELSVDEMGRVMAPTTSASPLIEDLSPRERAAFVELLKVEWESAQ